MVGAGCQTPTPVPAYPPLAVVPSSAPEAAAAPAEFTLTVVGTNDVHGHFERLDAFAGHLAVLRRLRASSGAVVLLDAGDMWQGTLPSNLDEGQSMVRAYGALGYDAAAIGNHEFDYGPIGERATPGGPDDDPRGALFARVAEASFPMLGANFRGNATGAPVQWPGVQRTVLLE